MEKSKKNDIIAGVSLLAVVLPPLFRLFGWHEWANFADSNLTNILGGFGLASTSPLVRK